MEKASTWNCLIPCIMRYHCSAFFEWSRNKLMEFLKVYEFFPLNLTSYVFLYLITARLSGIGQRPEKNDAVLWEITVAPFLKETGPNSWASESFFYALLNETGQKHFLLTVLKIWTFKDWMILTPENIIFTVLWDITVGPFLNEAGPNSKDF